MFQRLPASLLRPGLGLIAALLLIGCSTPSLTHSPSQTVAASSTADDANAYTVVHCLVAGQIRRIGGMTYVGKRKPRITTVRECQLLGGEYVLDTSTSYEAALSAWQDAANRGNAEAQYYTGEIYEKGLSGQKPDYSLAAVWYQKAASQGYKRAAVNLGHLYEQGLGVERNPEKAVQLYRQAAELNPGSLPLLMAPTEGESEKSTTRSGATEAPVIDLIDPPLTVSGGFIRLTLPEGEGQKISGRVIAPAGLKSLTVNGQSIPTSEAGYFHTELPKYRSGDSGDSDISLQIAALDNLNQRATLGILVATGTRGGAELSTMGAPATGFGQYHALVIGNNDYRHWQPLDNAINDARAVAQQLRQHYGFEVTELYDAERAAILSAINDLRKQLTENDNLLIYYAGHGHLVKELDEGYWIPVDAKQDDNTEWISTRNITGQLKIMSAKHVLVVADSCYAGTLSRGSLSRLKPGISETKRMQLLASFASSRVRTALTSGGVQPVLDSGGSGHSVFTKAFLDVLRENGLTLETERLFLAIRERVSSQAFDMNVRQIPTYEPIHMAGHEAGDFVFLPL